MAAIHCLHQLFGLQKQTTTLVTAISTLQANQTISPSLWTHNEDLDNRNEFSGFTLPVQY
jgi:hypothetical protein